MVAAPFPTPRTPRRYKRKCDPPSPLAPYSQPLPLALPSLQAWKKVCKEHSFTSTSVVTISTIDSDGPGGCPYEFSDVLCALSQETSASKGNTESASVWTDGDHPIAAVFASDKATQRKRRKRKNASYRLSTGRNRDTKRSRGKVAME